MTTLKSSPAPSVLLQLRSFSHRPGYRPPGWRRAWTFISPPHTHTSPLGSCSPAHPEAGGRHRALPRDRGAAPGRAGSSARRQGARGVTQHGWETHRRLFLLVLGRGVRYFCFGSTYRKKKEILVPSVPRAPEPSAPAHLNEYLKSVSKSRLRSHLYPPHPHAPSPFTCPRARPQRQSRHYFFFPLPRDPENPGFFPTASPSPAAERRWGEADTAGQPRRNAPHRTARSPVPGRGGGEGVSPAAGPAAPPAALTLMPCCWVVSVSLDSSRSKTSQ